MGATEGNAAVDWLLEAMADDRAEAAVHATPEMTAMQPAHLPDNPVLACEPQES